jgi:pyruvate/2-oxoglutarate dehydrogenase complex dihydrolipoamide dehydrogenase (E3) component
MASHSAAYGHPHYDHHRDLNYLRPTLTVPQSVSGFDCLLGATGRSPLVNNLQLEVTTVTQEKESGYITLDAETVAFMT